MKKRVWVVSPAFYTASICLAVMALISLPFNRVLFLIDISAALAATLIIRLSIRGFENYVTGVLKCAESSLCGTDTDFLQRIPIPTVLVGKNGDITGYNFLFRDVVGEGRGRIGETVLQFLSGEALNDVLAKNGVEILYNGRNYTVYGSQMKEAAALYFIECTEYKIIKQKYLDGRPVVAFILFDNMEELKRDSTDGQLSQLSSMVEGTLREWAAETTGFLKKLNDGKYMAVFEERHMREFTSGKFKILNKIHTVKLDDYRNATVSIGIGRGASTTCEAERWAQSALDMALGRGGDQVAVKKGDSYEFFGGTSKEVEKRSKVRTRVIAAALREQMMASDVIFTMGHRFSDLDSIGAAVGLWSVASKMKNKISYVVVNRETSLAGRMINYVEKSLERNVFISPEKAKSLKRGKTLLIAVDTHSKDFLESRELYELCDDVVVIDHHRMMVDHISDAVIFYHEPFASSCCEMVTELIQYMGGKDLKKQEAECLLSGIMLDTKNFFMKTGVRTFEAAAYLKKRGADTVEVKKMFSNSIDVYKIRCKIIESAKIVNDCAVAKIDGSYGDVRVACAQAADELLGVRHVKASFVIFQTEGKVGISARSLGEVNVQVIMEKMGGGGHQTMAAVQIEGISLDTAEENLMKALGEFREENK